MKMEAKKKMNLLMLEDDYDVVGAFNTVYSKRGVIIDHVDNLLDLNYCLYENPGVDEYDLVLLDLAVNMPNLTTRDIREALPQMPEYTTSFFDRIKLYGWDYYINIICKQDTTKKESAKKFILISGHAHLLQEQGIFSKEKYPSVRLIDKADKRLYDIISEIITQKN